MPSDPAAPHTVEKIFGDDLDIHRYGVDWVLFYFDAETNEYVNPGINGVLQQGVGYWIIQQTQHDISIDIDGHDIQPSGYSTSLYANGATGWNMAGHSKASPTHWNQFKIKTSGGQCAQAEGCTPAESSAENIFYHQAWYYDGQSYVTLENEDVLPALAGFWCATLPGAEGLSPQLIHPPQQ